MRIKKPKNPLDSRLGTVLYWRENTYSHSAALSNLTQTQVAELCQVSQATVSRVLKGDPRVDTELRDRVLAIVEAHDYAPDVRAQSLRSQRTQTIGLVAHRSPAQLAGDPFFGALVASIIEVTQKNGYHLCLDTARSGSGRWSIYEELLRTRRVDGLILVEPRTEDECITRLSEAGFPFVLIGRCESDKDLCSVDNDNRHAGYLATRHLLDRGYRHIAYVGGPKGVVVSEDRRIGYLRALAEEGLAPEPTFCLAGDFTEAGGRRAIGRLLQIAGQPTAVVAVDDVTAVGIARGAREAGLRIPEQLGVVGFNDSWFCPFVEPPITSVSVNIRKLGQAATGMLVGLLQDQPPPSRRQIVPCTLVVRDSS